MNLIGAIMRWLDLSRRGAKALIALLGIWLAVFAGVELGLSFIPLYPNWTATGLGIVVVFFSLLIYWTQCGREIDMAMAIRPARRFVRRWLRRYIGAEALIAAFFTFRPPSMGMGLTLPLALLVIGVILTRRVWRVLCFLGIIGLGVAGFHRLMTDDRPRNPIPKVVGAAYSAKVGVGKARLDLGAAEDLAKAAALGVATLDAAQRMAYDQGELQAFQFLLPPLVVDDGGKPPALGIIIPKVGDVVLAYKSTAGPPAGPSMTAVMMAFGGEHVVRVLLLDPEANRYRGFWVERWKGQLMAKSVAQKLAARGEPKKPEPLAVPTGYAVVWRDRVSGWMDTGLTVEEASKCVAYPCDQVQARIGLVNPVGTAVAQWRMPDTGLPACYYEPEMTPRNRYFRVWVNAPGKEVMFLKKV